MTTCHRLGAFCNASRHGLNVGLGSMLAVWVQGLSPFQPSTKYPKTSPRSPVARRLAMRLAFCQSRAINVGLQHPHMRMDYFI